MSRLERPRPVSLQNLSATALNSSAEAAAPGRGGSGPGQPGKRHLFRLRPRLRCDDVSSRSHSSLAARIDGRRQHDGRRADGGDDRRNGNHHLSSSGLATGTSTSGRSPMPDRRPAGSDDRPGRSVATNGSDPDASRVRLQADRREVRLPAFALCASARSRHSSASISRSGGGKPDTTSYTESKRL